MRLSALFASTAQFVSKRRVELIAIVAVGLLALGAHRADTPLIDWDEATYAQVAHEAVQHRDYLNLTWNGAPYLKKPPLLFWMQSASFKLFGEGEAAARLPSVLAGIGTMLLIYFAAAAVGGRAAGLLSALIPLGFYFFVARGGREAATDAPLLFFSTLTVLFAVRGRNARWWLWLAGAACGMAMLSKGPAGALPAIAIAISVALVPSMRAIGLRGLARFAIAAALVALPWYQYQAIQHSAEFWSVLVGQETLARLTSHLEDHRHGAMFTLRTFGHELKFLWPLLLPVSALTWASIRQGLHAVLASIAPEYGVWLVWLVVTLGAACTVQTRLPWYILPALVPVALASGTMLAGALDWRRHYELFTPTCAVLALALLVAGAPRRWRYIEQVFRAQRDASLPSYTMGLRARELAVGRGASQLYFAGAQLPTLVYYSRIHCNFVAPGLNSGADQVADPSAAGLNKGDLILVDSDGVASPVSNYDDEYRIDLAGGSAHRSKVPMRGAAGLPPMPFPEAGGG